MLDFCLTFGVHFTNTGQFLSKDRYEGDTSNPITLNKYLYAHANPVTYEDPSGYFAQPIVAVSIQAQLNKIDVGAKFPVLALAGTVAAGLTAHILSQQGLINIFEGMSTGAELWSMFNQAIRAAKGDSEGSKSEESVTEGKVEDLPDNVQESYKDYEKNGWKKKSNKSPGTKDDGSFKNNEERLPQKDNKGNDINYREHDVNNKVQGEGRDSERFVTGSDGSVYYTDDHYGTFVKLR